MPKLCHAEYPTIDDTKNRIRSYNANYNTHTASSTEWAGNHPLSILFRSQISKAPNFYQLERFPKEDNEFIQTQQI